jgi:hypothetical protein
VNLRDPKGLLISPWHRVITVIAAWNSGLSVSDSLKLASDVASKDSPPWENVDKSANASNVHTMGGWIKIDPNTNEYTWQTRDETLSKVLDIIQKGDLPSALHALQDLPGHNLESMEDFDLNWSTVKHVLRDIFDIFWMYRAYENTKKFLKAKQPCK